MLIYECIVNGTLEYECSESNNRCTLVTLDGSINCQPSTVNRQPSTAHAKALTVEDGRSVRTLLALRLRYLV